jgi:hypothetical protein
LLEPGQAYNQNVEIYISPNTPAGDYKFILSVDYNDNVFTVFNNSRSLEAKLNIEALKPFWSISDFYVTVTSSEDKSINYVQIKYLISFDYLYETAAELVWTDAYYISEKSTFDQNNSFKLGELLQSLVVNQTKNYQIAVNQKYVLDNALFGKYYVFIYIDENQLIDKAIETIYIDKIIQVNKIPGMLKLTEFSLFKEILETSYGYEVSIHLTLLNIGKTNISYPEFKFSAETTTGISIFLKNYKSEKTISLNQTIDELITLNLSFQLFGKIKINIKNNDNSYSLNVSAQALDITIQQVKSPDLVVQRLDFINNSPNTSCNDNIFSLNVSYSVQNIAYSMEKLRAWEDKISLTCEKAGTIFSKSINFTKQLLAQETYTYSFQFITNLLENRLIGCYVRLDTNINNGAIELFSMDNNFKQTCCFIIREKPDSEFEPVFLENSLNNLQAGDVYEISYKIKNNGNSSRNSKTSWKDSLFLHKNKTSILENVLNLGTLVGEIIFSNYEINCGDSSRENFTVKLQSPLSFSGIFYAYLIHDIQRSNLNLSKLVNSSIQVNIIEIEPCDLLAQNETVLSESKILTGGDEIKFSFEVYNNGSGKARGGWYDAIYLSKFPSVSKNDVKLLTVARKKELFQFESYTVEFQVKLPLAIRPGEYFLVFVTDTLQVLRDLNPDNNQGFIAINIIALPNVDIFISNTTISGLNFTWALKADQNIAGRFCDMYYLSKNYYYNFVDDYELSGGSCYSFEIKEITQSIKYEKEFQNLPLIPDGVYNGLVRVITNIEETNLENNVGIANKTISVEVQILEIEKLTYLQLQPNQNHLFKIEPGVGVDTLKVELKTDFQNAYNDILTDINRVPSENSFISSSRFSFSFNQSTLIKNVRPERYFLIIKSFFATSFSPYDVTVYIKNIQDVDIDLIEPKQLSILGKNTVKLVGNFVPQKLKVILIH